MYHAKRITMLHHIGLISLFYCLGHQLISDIAAVYKVILKVPVGTI